MEAPLPKEQMPQFILYTVRPAQAALLVFLPCQGGCVFRCAGLQGGWQAGCAARAAPAAWATRSRPGRPPPLASHPSPAPSPASLLQHDDGIIPAIVDAVKATVGDRTNPNGCAIPLTWCAVRRRWGRRGLALQPAGAPDCAAVPCLHCHCPTQHPLV